MKRVIWLVMDSFGLGNAKDAALFDDEGADTLGNIAKNFDLNIPNMSSLGLLKAYELNNNKKLDLSCKEELVNDSFYGVAKEASGGKDTLSGHWEMAGVLSNLHMKYFPKEIPAFPKEMMDEIISKSGIKGTIGNRHAGGIEIIESLGQEHIETNKPIFYTSADSVIQIAVHEEKFGLENLYRLCEITREVSNKYSLGRVIARPFVEDEDGNFVRTKHRKDYSLRATGKTVIENAKENSKEVIAIGKIYDIFAGYGVTKKCLAYGLEGLMNETLKQIDELKNDGIIYTNFVDFDMEWGHRRDVEGYAKGLEYFDLRLKEVLNKLQDDDLLIITADHGCDPTFKGSDHTRENVPIFGVLKNSNMNSIGVRDTFADIASSIEEFFSLPNSNCGKSFLK